MLSQKHAIVSAFQWRKTKSNKLNRTKMKKNEKNLTHRSGLSLSRRIRCCLLCIDFKHCNKKESKIWIDEYRPLGTSHTATVPCSLFWWAIALYVTAASPKMRTSMNNAQWHCPPVGPMVHLRLFWWWRRVNWVNRPFYRWIAHDIINLHLWLNVLAWRALSCK